MAKQLPVADSRTVGHPADEIARVVMSSIQVGVKDGNEDGSATFTRCERNGNTISFDVDFEGAKKVGFKTFKGNGTINGTLNLVPLGANTTRMEIRGNVTIEGAAAMAPDFILNKIMKSQLNSLFDEFLAELDGPGAGGLGAA